MKKTDKKKDEKLSKWQAKLSSAKASYEDTRRRMDVRDGYYLGTHEIAGKGGEAAKRASNVRNIVYELIESQVDSSVPMPRVTAIHEEDRELAKKIEALLLNQVRLLALKSLNDGAERTVPIQGGDWLHVEWDAAAGFHCTAGNVAVHERHPRQVIPQPGVYDVQQMEYIFVLVSQPKEALERRYDVTLDEDTESDLSARTRADSAETVEGLVTQVIAYSRNARGGIDMFSWVGDTVLEDLEDFQARRIEVCAACGKRKAGKECVCGSRRFKALPTDREELTQDIRIFGGEVVEAGRTADVPVINPDGSVQRDVLTGEPVLVPGPFEPNTIPYYVPDVYPLVLRRNVCMAGQLLGTSDVDVIADQQEAIKKFGTKAEEKLLKGGSYVTLPQGVTVETTDKELKVLRLKNPAEKSLIDVLNVQPDTSRDLNMLETNYLWAKSTLGITDAFQGKYDASATSGSAKQFSAQQAAGRLQSKREQKNLAYAALYKMMFQYMLAYSDEAFPMTYREPDGRQTFAHFDRYEFLKRDAAGELYWNDEFIFEVDPSSNLASNREALWNMIDVKYQAGGFGPINELQSQYRLWTLLEATDYPYAGQMKASIKQQMDEQQMNEQQMLAGGAEHLEGGAV